MNTGLIIPSYFFCRKRYRDSKKYIPLFLYIAQYLALHARSIYIMSVNTLTAAREVALERGTESARTGRGEVGEDTHVAPVDATTSQARQSRQDGGREGKLVAGRAPGEPSRQSGVSSERDGRCTVRPSFVHRSRRSRRSLVKIRGPKIALREARSGRSDVTLVAVAARGARISFSFPPVSVAVVAPPPAAIERRGRGGALSLSRRRASRRS